ncbi:hypothetical protein RDI58_007675 [Solanum bulbocastanum]|uniref:Uncharacterized protein n=1 Tax=Solanum bulbocastanum TaxID=147425 RepID=A0AAN8U1T0_SOLBU
MRQSLRYSANGVLGTEHHNFQILGF